MSPELRNEKFLNKIHTMHTLISLMIPDFQQIIRYVAASVVTEIHTHKHTHRTTTITLANILVSAVHVQSSSQDPKVVKHNGG